jgi:6-pyruvoyltetrahydropterin/6-carboxytetrahydropterin synthase
MFCVTRRYRFASSHRLHAPSLDAERNRELYGKCNNPFGHGHNYELEVSARGPLDAVTARAVDIEALDALVHRSVLAPLDHRNLNEDVEAFREAVPTSENLAVEIGRRLKSNWRTAFSGEWPRLEKIKIAETERNIFEIRSDEIE